MPWDPVRGGLPDDQGGWKPRGPAAEPFSPALKMPAALTVADIEELRTRWVQAARRAVEAGFQAVELHSAHGYLFHQFLSPLSNPRTDGYGGGFDGRTRFLRETAAAVRDAIPDSMPLLVRLSTTDWIEGGWDLEQSVELSRLLKTIGVDLMDCSSGGARLDAKIPVGPGFQVPMAEAIRRQAGIPTAAVGMITTPEQAEAILAEGRADALMIGRCWLDDPHWAIHAAKTLGAAPPWPKQYAWVFAPKA